LGFKEKLLPQKAQKVILLDLTFVPFVFKKESTKTLKALIGTKENSVNHRERDKRKRLLNKEKPLLYNFTI
jgi:hypothetical protein